MCLFVFSVHDLGDFSWVSSPLPIPYIQGSCKLPSLFLYHFSSQSLSLEIPINLYGFAFFLSSSNFCLSIYSVYTHSESQFFYMQVKMMLLKLNYDDGSSVHSFQKLPICLKIKSRRIIWVHKRLDVLCDICLNNLFEMTCCSPNSSLIGLIIPQVHQEKLSVGIFIFCSEYFSQDTEVASLSFLFGMVLLHKTKTKSKTNKKLKTSQPFDSLVTFLSLVSWVACITILFFFLLLNFIFYLLSHCSCPPEEYKL